MSAIKECFISRFPEGVLLESDFSQLEVVGLAALSRDPQLIEDLLAGRDMHTHYTIERYAKKGIVLTPDTLPPGSRFITKRMTFQLQYGSGAPNMARKMGIPEQEAADFIEAYYERYSRVKEWQGEVYEAVKGSRTPSERRGAGGELPLYRGQYESLTGRLYTFYETEAPAWKRDKNPSFPPTQAKNYPVQGFATGDIMALFRAEVWRWWVMELAERRQYGKPMEFLPNNTVHDSIMFDCLNLDVARYVANMMERIAEGLVDKVKDLWDIDCPVPFKIESKAGPTWATMEKL